MVGTRHLQGTVVQRMRALLRTGVYKKPPIWLPIVEAFPPLPNEENDALENQRKEIPKIKFNIDNLNKRIYNEFKVLKQEPLIFMPEKHPQKQDPWSLFYNKYEEMLDSNNGYEDMAFDKTINWFTKNITIRKQEKKGYKSIGAAGIDKSDNECDEIPRDILDFFKSEIDTADEAKK